MEEGHSRALWSLDMNMHQIHCCFWMHCLCFSGLSDDRTHFSVFCKRRDPAEIHSRAPPPRSDSLPGLSRLATRHDVGSLCRGHRRAVGSFAPLRTRKTGALKGSVGPVRDRQEADITPQALLTWSRDRGLCMCLAWNMGRFGHKTRWSGVFLLTKQCFLKR